MAQYYVDPAGSGSGAGTIGSPWSLAILFSNAGFPTNTVQPGDTVWLRGGTYNRADLTWNCQLQGAVGSGIDNIDGKIIIRN
jgi:hypothetical protein